MGVSKDASTKPEILLQHCALVLKYIAPCFDPHRKPIDPNADENKKVLSHQLTLPRPVHRISSKGSNVTEVTDEKLCI